MLYSPMVLFHHYLIYMTISERKSKSQHGNNNQLKCSHPHKPETGRFLFSTSDYNSNSSSPHWMHSLHCEEEQYISFLLWDIPRKAE